MPAISLVFLLVIVGGLTLFALQNWSPSLSLIFLGSPTPPLPLAVWILLLLAAGVMTGLSIAALFRWYSYLEARSLRRRPRYEAGSAYPAGSSPPEESQASETDFIRRSQTRYQAHQQRDGVVEKDERYAKNPTPSAAASTKDDRGAKNPTPSAAASTKGDRGAKNSPPSAAASNNDDWEQENKRSDDWDDTVSTDRLPRQSRGNEGDGTTKAGPGQGTDSFYSYGSQDKSNSGVGKTEDVYEANYRVITPTVRSEFDEGENDEDWGLDDDEN